MSIGNTSIMRSKRMTLQGVSSGVIHMLSSMCVECAVVRSGHGSVVRSASRDRVAQVVRTVSLAFSFFLAHLDIIAAAVLASSAVDVALCKNTIHFMHRLRCTRVLDTAPGTDGPAACVWCIR